jgi:hypothetical protein
MVELFGRYSKIPAPMTMRSRRTSCKPQSSTPRIHAVRKRLGPDVIRQLVRDLTGRSTTWLMPT